MSGSAKQPVPLLGRLAVQLELMTPDQLSQALAARARRPDQPIGDLFVELGLLSPTQLGKLAQVQRDVIARHRAKAAAAKAQSPSSAAVAAPPVHQPAPAAPAPAVPAPAPPKLAMPAPVPQTAAAAAELQPASIATPPVAAPPQKPAGASVASDGPAAECESLGLTLGRGEGDRDRLLEILRVAVEAGASDIHIHAGAPVMLRTHGVMASTGEAPLGAEEAERLTLAALEPYEQEELARAGEIDACLAAEGIGRFRLNAYRQQRGFDAVFRSIPAEPPTLASLGLPEELGRFTHYHQGMVLITGPAGCGKSATMAALVNMINGDRDEHILTVEDPIEYVHRPKRCHVNQRHAGRHTGSFARALRAALREDPDVIVIGELRDLETISLAMTAAETGHFVLATLHTANAVRTINRMIGAFPSNRQGQVRTMLSESLRAVISQRLVPTADESKRVAALETLVVNKAIANLIRDEKTVQIRSALQTGAALGMRLLEQSLDELVRSGTITLEAALGLAEDKKLLQG